MWGGGGFAGAKKVCWGYKGVQRHIEDIERWEGAEMQEFTKMCWWIWTSAGGVEVC